MATQGYQEYQGGYHSMPNGVPNHGHYEHWNHHQHSFPPPNDHIPYHVSTVIVPRLPVKWFLQAYHNGYGNYHYGHYGAYDGGSIPYNPYYQNQSYYEMNNYDSNSFLPSDCSDCIFISGLPKSIQKDEIISTFSQVGKIKVAKGLLLFICVFENLFFV